MRRRKLPVIRAILVACVVVFTMSIVRCNVDVPKDLGRLTKKTVPEAKYRAFRNLRGE